MEQYFSSTFICSSFIPSFSDRGENDKLGRRYIVILRVEVRRFKPAGASPRAVIICMAVLFPPTIIIRHPHENPRKCSVLPLRGRPDLVFLRYPVRERP